MLTRNLDPLDVGTIQIPFHFRCPISLELMCDPVTVSTGQTYDRISIETWVAAGNVTCPVTRSLLVVDPLVLIPNHTLRRLIQEWCVAHRSSGVQRIPTPKQPADPSLLRSLVFSLQSSSSSAASRLSSLRRLRSFAADSDKTLAAIASLNAPKLLLRLLFSSIPDSANEPDHLGSEGSDTVLDFPDLARESLTLLVMLPLPESDCEAVASDARRVQLLVSLLFHPSIEVRVNAAALIEMVASGTSFPELRAGISGADGVFEGVVEVLRFPMAHPRALKVGVKALFALCLVKQSRHRAVGAGAAEALVDKLAEMEKCDAERALATVELLCRVPEGCAAFAAHALTVPLLVKTILKVSDRATEYATGALLSLCSAAEGSQREAVRAGVITQLLFLVQSECTQRAKRKAQLLLKLFRDSWPGAPNANSDDLACGDLLAF